MRGLVIFLLSFYAIMACGGEVSSNMLDKSMLCLQPSAVRLESSHLASLKSARVSYLTGSDLEFCYAVKYMHDYYKTALSTRNWDSDKNFIALRKMLDACSSVLYPTDEEW